jgi:D-aminoacyl-tRNA deacylase
MRVIIQRVNSASVTVQEKVISKIGKGLLCLVGVGDDDTKEDSEFISRKILNLRLWDDKDGKRWNKSVMDMKYEVLLVSQFTLYSVLKGNKPDFHKAMKPELSQEFFDTFVKEIKAKYEPIQTGEFGAYMNVDLQNDGPITIVIDSRNKEK